ncbi:MAG TPA: hypothetical protein VNW92_18255 [Polyangiaceae bacterium]|nr:hypothetical protein [Polyangiaceae bacterium]
MPSAPSFVATPEPARNARAVDWNADRDLPTMFDGAARRRRVGLILALIALAAVAATAIAAIASHYRPM